MAMRNVPRPPASPGDGLLADQHVLHQTHRDQRVIRSRNASNLEVAKLLRVEFDALGGSLKAVCLKNRRSASWVSKRLAMLTLQEQAERLVREDITADVEVILDVRYIEHVDRERARVVVDQLCAERGKANARDLVRQIRTELKAQERLATNLANQRTASTRR